MSGTRPHLSTWMLLFFFLAWMIDMVLEKAIVWISSSGFSSLSSAKRARSSSETALAFSPSRIEPAGNQCLSYPVNEQISDSQAATETLPRHSLPEESTRTL